jgi:hypothetical protein
MNEVLETLHRLWCCYDFRKSERAVYWVTLLVRWLLCWHSFLIIVIGKGRTNLFVYHVVSIKIILYVPVGRRGLSWVWYLRGLVHPAFGRVVCSAEITFAPCDSFRHWMIILSMYHHKTEQNTETNKAMPRAAFGSMLLMAVRTLDHVIVRISLCKYCFWTN